jgi:succinate dehydrogenase / fumarate reductase, cytochrome b subunit
VSRLGRFWGSTVGKKIVMGVTGLIMVGFLVGHMLGNLQIFLGPTRLNDYSRFLHSLGELLWLVRAVLLVSLVLHIVAAVQLTRIDWAARPVGYAKYQPEASTFASRTIRWGGLLLAAFILFHLLHFTTGTIRPAPFSHTDVYGNVTASFAVPWVAALYVAAMLVVALHLYHGTWSAFRTLGVAPPSAQPRERRAATALAGLVWLGFTIVPVAVFLRWVR